MFFLSIARSENDISFQSLREKKICGGRFVATIAGDNFPPTLAVDERDLGAGEPTQSLVQALREMATDAIVVTGGRNTLVISSPAIYGIPLYYHTNSYGEFFCSTHVRLLREAGVTILEDTDSLPEFFVYRFGLTTINAAFLLSPSSGPNLRTILTALKRFHSGQWIC
jgi:hypothetical protein